MHQDFAHLAAIHSRESFVSQFPDPFLVGEAALRERMRKGRVPVFDAGNTFNGDEQMLALAGEGQRLVLPVRKVQPTFESMITVGRTKNNDVIIADVAISKFHAFFRIVDKHYELADAGSQNGTRVTQGVVERLLEPKGPAVRLSSGDVIRFAELRFRFLDSAACWDELGTH
jgi:hypothetical protein